MLSFLECTNLNTEDSQGTEIAAEMHHLQHVPDGDRCKDAENFLTTKEMWIVRVRVLFVRCVVAGPFYSRFVSKVSV